jgi:putative transposase
MARMPYATDLTDLQWKEIEPYIPPERPGGRPRHRDMREVINGIFYVLRTGCPWRHMPHDLPNPKTCWFYFNRFSAENTWRTISEALHPAARVRAGRDAIPSQAIVDAQSVKTTKKGAPRKRSVLTREKR